MSQAPCTLFWPRSGFTPTPRPADIAGRHGEVGDRHDRGRALAVLGDAEAVVDRAIAAGGDRGAPRRGWSSAGTPEIFVDFLRAVLRLGDEGRPVLELRPVAALADEGLVEQALGDDDMRQRGQHRDIGAGPQRQVMRAPRHARSARCRCGADRARSAWRPARRRFFMPRGEDRMAVGRVGADHHDRRRYARPSRSPACRPRCRRSGRGRSRSASGRRGRRCRHCCCRSPARISFWTR